MSGKYAIRIDIGGTYTKTGLVSGDGSVSRLVCIPAAARQEPSAYLERLGGWLLALLAESPSGSGDLTARFA